jgi:drug/metabolite transporter (DMT)-like permease
MQVVNNRWIIYTVFIVLWGSGAIFVDLGLRFTDPLPFLALRFLIATVLMWLFCLLIRPSFPKRFSEWRMIILTVMFQQICYQLFYFLTLFHHVSPGILTIILGAQPILTSLFMRKGTDRFQWFGLFFGMMGLVLVVGRQIFSGTLSAEEILYSLFSLASITVGTIMQKYVRINLPMNVSIQYTCSFVIFSILSFVFGTLDVKWTGIFFISLLFMSLGVTVGATLLLYYMIQNENLTNTTSIFYCVPPFTAVMDYFVFGHKLHGLTFIGLILIIAGMILINKKTILRETINQSEKM